MEKDQKYEDAAKPDPHPNIHTYSGRVGSPAEQTAKAEDEPDKPLAEVTNLSKYRELKASSVHRGWLKRIMQASREEIDRQPW